MENKFKTGDIVYERTNPYQLLVIARYYDGVYYCRNKEFPKRQEIIFFERELKADTSPKVIDM